MSGTDAYKALRTVMEWHVSLNDGGKATSARSKQESHLLEEAKALREFVPRQRTPLYPDLLERLPSKERMILRLVFAMVNGRRTVSQIKAQLRLPSETVDRALWELQRMQVIE